jgi:hypothetical protein
VIFCCDPLVDPYSKNIYVLKHALPQWVCYGIIEGPYNDSCARWLHDIFQTSAMAQDTSLEAQEKYVQRLVQVARRRRW